MAFHRWLAVASFIALLAAAACEGAPGTIEELFPTGGTGGAGNAGGGGSNLGGGGSNLGGAGGVIPPPECTQNEDCTPGFLCCDEVCINPNNDHNHCGTCDNVCTDLVCNEGLCVPWQDYCGETECPGDPNHRQCCGVNCCDEAHVCCALFPVPPDPEPKFGCIDPDDRGTCPEVEPVSR